MFIVDLIKTVFVLYLCSFTATVTITYISLHTVICFLWKWNSLCLLNLFCCLFCMLWSKVFYNQSDYSNTFSIEQRLSSGCSFHSLVECSEFLIRLVSGYPELFRNHLGWEESSLLRKNNRWYAGRLLSFWAANTTSAKWISCLNHCKL